MLSWSSLNASANWTWLCPAETVSELYFCRYQIVACLALVCDINTVCWHQSPMSVEGFQVYYCPLVLMLIDVTHYKVKLNLTQSSCSCCTNHFEKIFSNYDLVLNVQQFLKCLGRQSDTFWKFQWAVCVEPIAAKMLFSILSCWRWNVSIAESWPYACESTSLIRSQTTFRRLSIPLCYHQQPNAHSGILVLLVQTPGRCTAL